MFHILTSHVWYIYPKSQILIHFYETKGQWKIQAFVFSSFCNIHDQTWQQMFHKLDDLKMWCLQSYHDISSLSAESSDMLADIIRNASLYSVDNVTVQDVLVLHKI